MNDKTNQKEEFSETTQTLRRILGTIRESQKVSGKDELRTTRDDSYNNRISVKGDGARGPINEQITKRNSRQRDKFYPSGRSRSNDKMGTRRTNPNGGKMVSGRTRKSNGGSTLKKNEHIRSQRQKKLLKQTREEYIGVTRRTGYQKPMEMFAPTVRTNGDDSIIMTGSEFLDFVTVNTTAHTSPTEPGDTIAFVPLNPMLLSGTRLAQMASLYQKYKYLDVTVEFVPSISSLQDGSLIMLYAYDPTENFSTTTSDKSELMRLALSHLGANMFNVYDYGRTVLTTREDALNNYFTKDGVNCRQEMQAIFLCIAGSTYTNDVSQLTLGSFVIHYHVRFDQRALIEPISLNESYLVFPDSGTTTTTFFTLSADTSIALNQAAFSGFSLRHENMVYIIKIDESAVAEAVVFLGYDKRGDYDMFKQGSIWFGRFLTESNSAPMYIYSDLEQACDGNLDNPVQWAATVTGAVTFDSFHGTVTGIFMSEV